MKWPVERALRWVAGAVGAIALCNCSSLRASAIPTGPEQRASFQGLVAVYALGQAPEGAAELGSVEVYAYQNDADIDSLLAQFTAKVAQIGGNAAVIDSIRASFDRVERAQVDAFYYRCAYGVTCMGARAFPYTAEWMRVSMTGRAMFVSPTVVPGPSVRPTPQGPAQTPSSGSDVPDTRSGTDRDPEPRVDLLLLPPREPQPSPLPGAS